LLSRLFTPSRRSGASPCATSSPPSRRRAAARRS
jgi:hypothetical protein